LLCSAAVALGLQIRYNPGFVSKYGGIRIRKHGENLAFRLNSEHKLITTLIKVETILYI